MRLLNYLLRVGKMKRKLERILDTADTKVGPKSKVALRHSDVKGRGLFATKKIKAGETVALYKLRIHKFESYTSPTNMVYSFTIYSPETDKEIDELIGDIDEHCFPPAQADGMTYLGPFVNEACGSEEYNASFDCANDDTRRRVAGKYMIYKIVADMDIKPGSEVCCHYGSNYRRNYIERKPE